ncbi:MAG TPA: hypothetical protein VI819_00195 [Patescibacteria group bacterium]|nr:hypothetical protein [Patescibacteria group bacterium]
MERISGEHSAINLQRKPTEAELLWLDTAPAVDILKSNLLYNRQEVLPLFTIIKEDVEIDEKNRRDIQAGIKHRGQASPIGVRPVLVSDEEWESLWNSQDPETKDLFPEYRHHHVLYEIHNGFHRRSVLEEEKAPTVEASVWYNMSDDEFDAERIKASLEHTVKFSRLATWIRDAFARSPWANSGLRIDQIFSLAANDSSGRNLINRFDLLEADIKNMKNWANRKAEEWESSVGALYQDLSIIVNLDPELIKKIRIGGGGSRGKGVLSPARVREVVKVFNLDTDPCYKMQNLLCESIINHDLNAKDLELVAPLTMMFKDKEEVLQMIFKDPHNIVPEYLDLLTESEQDDPTISNSNEDNQKTSAAGRSIFSYGSSGGNGANHYHRNPTIEDLEAENEVLRKRLEFNPGTASTGELKLLRTKNISVDEQRLLVELFIEGKPIRKIAEGMNVTTNKVWSLLNSVIVKFDHENEIQQLRDFFNKSNKDE